MASAIIFVSYIQDLHTFSVYFITRIIWKIYYFYYQTLLLVIIFFTDTHMHFANLTLRFVDWFLYYYKQSGREF